MTSELGKTQKALMKAMDLLVDALHAKNKLEFDNQELERKYRYYKNIKKPEHEMEIPEGVAKTIKRSLVWDKSNNREDINEAFGWVDERSHYEEMGG
jgi:hypothetical protein